MTKPGDFIQVNGKTYEVEMVYSNSYDVWTDSGLMEIGFEEVDDKEIQTNEL